MAKSLWSLSYLDSEWTVGASTWALPQWPCRPRICDGRFQFHSSPSGCSKNTSRAERWCDGTFTRRPDNQTSYGLRCPLGYPLSFVLTCGERADAPQAIGILRKWIQQSNACLLDGGYDSDTIREFIVQSSSIAVIPPRQSRTTQIECDKHLYKERHKVENLFQRLKQYRSIATRFEKKVTLFAAMIAIASILLWIKF